MALISCPECSKQVSDKAAQCPDCGFPVYQATISPVPPHPTTTIEQTSKQWKKVKLIALGLVAGSFLLSAGGGSGLGSWLLFAGIVIGLYGTFGAWWHHS